MRLIQNIVRHSPPNLRDDAPHEFTLRRLIPADERFVRLIFGLVRIGYSSFCNLSSPAASVSFRRLHPSRPWLMLLPPLHVRRVHARRRPLKPTKALAATYGRPSFRQHNHQRLKESRFQTLKRLSLPP